MRLGLIALSLFLGLAAPLKAGTIGLGVGGGCSIGTCPALPLPSNMTESFPFDFTFLLANDDEFVIDGSFTDRNNAEGLSSSYAFQITYNGSPITGSSGSQADTIIIQRDAGFETPASSADFTIDLVGAFSSDIASSSSANACFDVSLSCLGPVTPSGSFDVVSSPFLVNSTGGAFPDNEDFIANFGAGSPFGSYVVFGQTTPVTPPIVGTESDSFPMLAMGLCGVIALRVRGIRVA